MSELLLFLFAAACLSVIVASVVVIIAATYTYLAVDDGRNMIHGELQRRFEDDTQISDESTP